MEWWVAPVKWFALVVFIAVPVFAHLAMMQAIAGRVVWTMVVASIPLFIVLVGYHRWRVLPPSLLRADSRTPASSRRQKSFALAASQLLLHSGRDLRRLALGSGLISTNGNGHAITAFFVLSRWRR